MAPQAKAAATQLLCNLKSFALAVESDAAVDVKTVAAPPPVTPDGPEPIRGTGGGERKAAQGIEVAVAAGGQPVNGVGAANGSRAAADS